MASSGGGDWIARLEQGSGPVASPQVSAVDADAVRDLYDYQRDAVGKALERDGRILLAHDMGLGKTVTGLTIMNHYRGDWPLLILCPKAVLTQWAEEVARWCRHPKTGPPTTAIVKGKVTRQGKSVIDIKGSVVRGDMRSRATSSTRCFRTRSTGWSTRRCGARRRPCATSSTRRLLRRLPNYPRCRR